jgi:uncharacterized protein with ATP-grasp and redox domains
LKVGARCGYCILHRGYRMIQRSTDDEAVRVDAMAGLLQFLGKNYRRDTVPSHIGAERCRVIRRLTGCIDPYKELKREADLKALQLLPRMEDYVDSFPPAERFRAACRVACIGNVIEYDVPDHNEDIEEALRELEGGFHIDDTDEFKSLLSLGKKVLLITDNAGEIAFDRLVVRELRRLGCTVTVSVKAGPALNDALMEDAEAVGMIGEADEVITTGSDGLGVQIEECSEEFRAKFFGVDAIIAKGMANWETLTEEPAPCPLMYIMRTKCEPVASTVGAPLNVSVAKLVPAGWRL